MKKIILPIIIIAIAGGIFFGYVDTAYQEVKELSLEMGAYDTALDNSKELRATRDQLIEKYNALSSTDLDRLEKLLPDNVDNVRLVMDINNMAEQYGFPISSITVNREKETEKDGVVIDVGNSLYGEITLGFSVTAGYNDLLNFLQDLERSLRLVDVTYISFSAGDKDLYEYDIKLKTYWLK